MDALNAQIDETSSGIAANEADLKAATAVRKEEEASFSEQEKELVEVIGALERAIGVLEREARKGGAAMMQVQQASNVVQAIKTMVEGSMLGEQDAKTLTALVQSSQQDQDEDGSDGLGAPAAAAYESHSGTIIDTL